MKREIFNEGLMRFIEASPTPYHAVETMKTALEQAGFEALPEGESWLDDEGHFDLTGCYYITRNNSSIIAFNTGNVPISEYGFRMVGAHTDSPHLKIKPVAELESNGICQLGVEVYGGALLNPWFDRDLSIAGSVNYLSSTDQIRTALIDFRRPIAVIPSLAIHLDRTANKNRSVNPQTDLAPLILQSSSGHKPNLKHLITQQLQDQNHQDVHKILDYDLSLYDTQPPQLVGLNEEFLAASRLDNLLSCYTGLMALIHSVTQGNSDIDSPTLLVCNDHEEVGSRSFHGANSSFLHTVLNRMFTDSDALSQALECSVLISCDNAHALHPNYKDKHDFNHSPQLNQGPVIKYNANQSYATNSETAALFRWLCEQAKVKPQSFVMRSDLACGSTIGPITAAQLGVRTLDVGAPQLAMHSIRETAGSQDAHQLFTVLNRFYQLEQFPF